LFCCLSLSLIVDVKLSANRNARIRIAEGDDPAELASRFAKIYSLDKDATHILETVLRQSMIQRGILPDPHKQQQQEQEGNRGNNKHRHRHSHRSRSGSQSRRHSYDSYENDDIAATFGGNEYRRKHHHRPHRRHSQRRKSESRDSFLTLDNLDFGSPRDGDDLQPITIDDPQQFFEGNVGEGGGRNSRGNSGRNTPSNLSHNGYPRFHRIDTDHSEMLGDTSVVVVEEEYSSYTESGSSRSGSDVEGEEGSYYDEDDEQYSESSSGDKQDSYQNPFSRSYRHDAGDNNDQIASFLQKQGSARSNQRDRSSILSELL
jgi:hypothetical protein